MTARYWLGTALVALGVGIMAGLVVWVWIDALRQRRLLQSSARSPL